MLFKQLPIRLLITATSAFSWGGLARDWHLAIAIFISVFLITASKEPEPFSRKIELAGLVSVTLALMYLFVWVTPHPHR